MLLLAHIEAVLSRCRTKQTGLITSGNIKIDKTGMIVHVNNERNCLTPKEYDLLIYLVSNIDTVLSREKILNNVWNYDFFGDGRTVDTHVKQLRAKIGAEYIRTIHGRGYRFEVKHV